MSVVTLGFLESCESWRLESRFFPSKVGGKPAWLSLSPLPDSCQLTCEKCGKIMIFFCQIYAPYESTEEINNKQYLENFHRTIFLFVCRTRTCHDSLTNENLKVFRSALPRKNDFYPIDPPVEVSDSSFDITRWTGLCHLCGIRAHQQCGKCKKVMYCCRDHQIADWKSGHKQHCNILKVEKSDNNLKLLFPEWELATEIEQLETENVDEEKALAEYAQLKGAGKTGTLLDVSESDLEAHASSETDKTFAKFKKITSDYPHQVIRYCRGGQPLLIAEEPVPSNVPNCEYCGASRQFEFQIMPQILFELKEPNLDWGVLLIYTCKDSCSGDSINSYKKEYVFRQNVANLN